MTPLRAYYKKIPMKESAIKTNGAEIHIREYGKANGAPVILVHGGPGIAGTLTDLGTHIQDQVRVIEYDQRGTARSASAGPFAIQNHLEDLQHVIHQTGVSRPILIGHSFGGFLGLSFAASYGDLISKLVVISCAPLTQAAGREMDERLMSRMDESEKLKREKLLATKADANLSMAAKDEADVELMRLLFEKYQHNRKTPLHHLRARNMPAVMEANKEYMATRNSGELLQKIAKINLPVVAFHGQDDVIPPSALATLSEYAPKFESHLLPACGHFPWHEDNAATEFLPKLRMHFNT